MEGTIICENLAPCTKHMNIEFIFISVLSSYVVSTCSCYMLIRSTSKRKAFCNRLKWLLCVHIFDLVVRAGDSPSENLASYIDSSTNVTVNKLLLLSIHQVPKSMLDVR